VPANTPADRARAAVALLTILNGVARADISIGFMATLSGAPARRTKPTVVADRRQLYFADAAFSTA
jgi:hypothetical protein